MASPLGSPRAHAHPQALREKGQTPSRRVGEKGSDPFSRTINKLFGTSKDGAWREPALQTHFGERVGTGCYRPAVGKKKPWKPSDSLFRGDDKNFVNVPDPKSKTGIVPHILYLGGKGRSTPFTSTTESEDTAEYFAGEDGAVWETEVATATAESAKHLSRVDLLNNLKGFGKGKAKWSNAFEVKQAAAYVAQWSEHVLDWSATAPKDIETKIKKTFRKT